MSTAPKTASGRFSKEALLRDLRERRDEIRLRCGFNPGDGYAQLGLPPVSKYDPRMGTWMERADWYFRMREIETLMDMIANRQLGLSRAEPENG